LPRPRVTLSYAQSLDGSLAAEAGRPLALSGPEALQYTHQLRAAHEAILVGIGTVLADDPRLTARGVPGPQPQPIVLDGRLRCSLTANVLKHPRGAWLMTTEAAPHTAQAALESAGARIVCLPEERGRIHLPTLLDWLGGEGLRSVMVEGGSAVISAFLVERLAQRLALTIAPRYVGGVRALAAPCDLHLQNVVYRTLGADVIVEGDLA
jgi:GTP cyclohydrolase II